MKRFNLNAGSAVVFALAAFAGSGTSAAAQQTAQTFRACLVPQVGAMYLIGLEGLPGECLSSEHREVSWTEGGSPEDGSIGTATLQDGSVTTAKIAPGAVTRSQIAPNTISTNEIADFGIQASDIAGSAITGAKIAPGSVSGSKLTENAVGGRELDLRMENVFGTFAVRERLSPDFPSTGVFTLACPSGKDVLSGGFEFTRARDGMVVTSSRPRSGQTVDDSWAVTVRHSGTEAGEVRVHLLCADLR